jgi:fumarylacetoacetate (FAA) hydrolase
VLLGEAVIDLAAAAPLVFAEAEELRWDMLSLLQGAEEERESSSLGAAAEILAAVVALAGDEPVSSEGTTSELQGNGRHDQGQTGNLSLGGVEMLLPLAQVRLLAPLPRPSSLRLFETFSGTRSAHTVLPFFLFGNHGAISGPEAPIPLPHTEEMDYGLALACVIGHTGRDIAAEEAADYIAGYMIVNDWRARNMQADNVPHSYRDAKAYDFATTLGPWLVTPDELEIYSEDDGHLNLTMIARINHMERTSNISSRMHVTFAEMIVHASRDVTLYPGDVLSSGAVNSASSVSWLDRGDLVELEITGLGVLRNRIV